MVFGDNRAIEYNIERASDLKVSCFLCLRKQSGKMAWSVGEADKQSTDKNLRQYCRSLCVSVIHTRQVINRTKVCANRVYTKAKLFKSTPGSSSKHQHFEIWLNCIFSSAKFAKMSRADAYMDGSNVVVTQPKSGSGKPVPLGGEGRDWNNKLLGCCKEPKIGKLKLKLLAPETLPYFSG